MSISWFFLSFKFKGSNFKVKLAFGFVSYLRLFVYLKVHMSVCTSCGKDAAPWSNRSALSVRSTAPVFLLFSRAVGEQRREGMNGGAEPATLFTGAV